MPETFSAASPANGRRTVSERPVGRVEVMAAVLEAATELFAEKGPDAVTVREVADRAGVNHALIHRHYGTKEELLRVVLAQALARMTEVSAAFTSSRDDLTTIITAMRDIEPAIRLAAWAILAGYDINAIWPESPAIVRIQEVLANEQLAAPASRGPGNPRDVVLTSTALLLGWMIFRPLLERAGGLSETSGFDEQAMLHDTVQFLFDSVR